MWTRERDWRNSSPEILLHDAPPLRRRSLWPTNFLDHTGAGKGEAEDGFENETQSHAHATEVHEVLRFGPLSHCAVASRRRSLWLDATQRSTMPHTSSQRRDHRMSGKRQVRFFSYYSPDAPHSACTESMTSDGLINYNFRLAWVVLTQNTIYQLASEELLRRLLHKSRNKNTPQKGCIAVGGVTMY